MRLSLAILTFWHRSGFSPYTSPYGFAWTCVCGKQSPYSLLLYPGCYAGKGILHSLRPVDLPSSLTICLPIVLVFSTYPPVSVLVRFPKVLFATLFLDTWRHFGRLDFSKLLFALHFITKRRIFQPLLAKRLNPAYSQPGQKFHTSSRPKLKRTPGRTGILTGYPSTTPPLIRASC